MRPTCSLVVSVDLLTPLGATTTYPGGSGGVAGDARASFTSPGAPTRVIAAQYDSMGKTLSIAVSITLSDRELKDVQLASAEQRQARMTDLVTFEESQWVQGQGVQSGAPSLCISWS